MHISHITPDVCFFGNAGFNSNVYVYGKKILIDTGHDAYYARQIIEHLQKHDLYIENIVLTHPHSDHSSNIRIFQKEFNADVMVYEGLKNNYLKFGEKITGLNDGDLINVGEGLKLEVIHTPGHTPFDLCFYDREKKLLFSGDCVFTMGNVGRTDLPGGDRKKLVASIAILVKLDVDWLFPGHMRPVENGNDHIERSLEFVRGIWSEFNNL